MHSIKFRMLPVRDNEISPRKLCGGTAHAHLSTAHAHLGFQPLAASFIVCLLILQQSSPLPSKACWMQWGVTGSLRYCLQTMPPSLQPKLVCCEYKRIWCKRKWGTKIFTSGGKGAGGHENCFVTMVSAFLWQWQWRQLSNFLEWLNCLISSFCIGLACR